MQTECLCPASHFAEHTEQRKSYLSFTFVSFAIAVIFFLTFQSQPDTSEISGKFQSILAGIFGEGYIPEWVKSMSFLRAFAHVPLYLFLSLSSFASFYLYGVAFGRSLLISLILSSCVGLADESIKIYIPGREFDLVDWTLDVAGIISGLCIILMISIFFIRRRHEN